MTYSEDFIKRCKEIYPDWKELHISLDAGGEKPGTYLGDAYSSAKNNMGKMILDATTIEEAKEIVNSVNAKKQLYVEWGDIYYSTTQPE